MGKTAQPSEKEGELNYARELKMYQQKISNILESFTDAFFEVDRDWIVTYWNKEAEQLLSMPRKDIIGKNLWEVYEKAIPLKFFAEYHRAMRENVSVRFEEYVEHRNLWVEVSAFPSGDTLSVYFKDITARIKYMNAIEEQNKRLIEISWLQSHKVRAPLARILGLVELLENQDASQISDIRELTALIRKSADELDQVVREISNK